MRRSLAPSRSGQQEIQMGHLQPPPAASRHNQVAGGRAQQSSSDRPAVVAIDVGEDTLGQATTAAATYHRPNNGNVPCVEASDRWFSVVHGKVSTRKHKVWSGDGYLECTGRQVVLCDEAGQLLAKQSAFAKADLANLQDGSRIVLGGREVEIQSELSHAEFASQVRSSVVLVAPSGTEVVPSKFDSAVVNQPKQALFRPAKRFVNPLTDLNGDFKRRTLQPGEPLYPVEADSLVMPEPSDQHQEAFNSQRLSLTPVVVDPHVSRRLRAHQRQGVAFVYACLTGIRAVDQLGCILADHMGLGKSLQAVAAVWTLIKQGPYGLRPVVRRVLLVCPSTLIQNWADEFAKWLGNERLKTFSVRQSSEIRAFRLSTHVNPVCVCSYEMASRCADQLAQCQFDLLICDEAHRLKNQSIKLTASLEALDVDRRLLLTGTPLQNDLQELYAVASFANPGCLGTAAAFRRVYEEPIVAGQDARATQQQMSESRQVLNVLLAATQSFMLRRTQAVNRAYLPPKDEYVLFCRASDAQQQLYRHVLGASCVQSALASQAFGAQHLVLIDALRKLCNHPAILVHALNSNSSQAVSVERSSSSSSSRLLLSDLPAGALADHQHKQAAVDDSGKLSVLCDLLDLVRPTGEKVVVVSNYTMTLQLLECMCAAHGYRTICLTGKTAANRRQELVKQFNAAHDNTDVFLLSSKAGGCGLNLIGANHIVLFDVDWNPACDQQALSRVWRDGQTRPTHVYRFATAGSIEEKILQRQVKKQRLCDAVVDGRQREEDEEDDGAAGGGGDGQLLSTRLHFSAAELADLFAEDLASSCATHVSFGCRCPADGTQQHAESTGADDEPPPSGVAWLCSWRHLARPALLRQADTTLLGRLAQRALSLTFAMHQPGGAIEGQVKHE